MKILVVCLLAAVCIVALCEEAAAMPGDKDAKTGAKDSKETKDSGTAWKDAANKAKEAKKNKKECVKECGDAYDPICVHDPNNAAYKARTFGTQCALDVHNCEMGTKLTVKNKGECAGAGGVRLS